MTCCRPPHSPPRGRHRRHTRSNHLSAQKQKCSRSGTRLHPVCHLEDPVVDGAVGVVVGGAGVVAGLVLCNIVVVVVKIQSLTKTVHPTLARHTQLPTVALAKPWWLTSSLANSHLSNTLPAGTLEVCSCRLGLFTFCSNKKQSDQHKVSHVWSYVVSLSLCQYLFLQVFYQTDNCNICSHYFTYFVKLLEQRTVPV